MKVKKYLDIGKILYSRDRRIIKTFLNLGRYRKVFLEAGIKLEDCEIVRGVNSILFLDKKNSIVYRCSLNKFGYIAISRNSDLLKNLKTNNAPLLLGLWKNDDIIVSAESLMQGRKLKAEDSDSAITAKIFQQLRPIYTSNLIKIKFDSEEWFRKCDYFLPYYNPLWINKLAILKETIIKKSGFFQKSGTEVINARIHGDLTFRNIMLNGKDIVFFDFDRSEIDFPEFDVYLFCLDRLTYIKKEITYEAFFNHISQFIKRKIDFSEIESFYDLNTEFNMNKQFEEDIRCLFLYRMIVLILQVFDAREDRRPLELLDRIIYEL